MFGNPASTVFPTSEVVVVPSRKRWCKLGRVNVVEPSPLPYVVPITAKRFAYVVLETFWPLHGSQPSGGVVAWKNAIMPVGHP